MSFRWLSLFRRGSWRSFRKFVLEERRDAEARISEIDREVNENIGYITVFYDNPDIAQARTGFSVTAKSSLDKLLKAYIAMGGNPLDISMFLDPKFITLEKDDEDNLKILGQAGLGGVVAPMSGLPNEHVYLGGHTAWDKHYWWKMGQGEIPLGQIMWVTSKTMPARDWVEKEIRNKRNKIEEKIIKLMDLREQLEQEKNLIKERLYRNGKKEYFKKMTIAAIVNSVDYVLWKQDGDTPNTKEETERLLTLEMKDLTKEQVLTNEDIHQRSLYTNIFDDAPSEKWPITAL